jgi:hypothetical protein
MIPVIQVRSHGIQTDAERLRLARITRRDVADRHLIVTAGEIGARGGRRRRVKLIGAD